jgi:hypothetical protein
VDPEKMMRWKGELGRGRQMEGWNHFVPRLVEVATGRDPGRSMVEDPCMIRQTAIRQQAMDEVPAVTRTL